MTTYKTLSKGIVHAVLTLLLLALLLFFIYTIRDIILYIIVALVICLIANPVIQFFQKRLKFNTFFAVSTTLVLFLLVLVGVILMFVPLINSQTDKLSLLNASAIETKLIEAYNKLKIYLGNHHLNIGALSSKSDLVSKLDYRFITNFINAILSFFANLGVTIATSLFISFCLLTDKTKFKEGIKKTLPDAHLETILNSVDKIKLLLSRYFIGLLIQLSIVFCMYLIVLLIFGIENALVIAFLCALLNIIPYIGPLIGTFLGATLSLLSNINADFQSVALPTTIYVAIGFFVVQLIDNNVTTPIIFSKSVDSHPLEIFMVILIAGTLFGITGMIVAIPLYTILKVVCKELFPKNKLVQALTEKI